MIKITDLFTVITAHSQAFSDYSEGNVAFVSNGFYNNGVVGYVEPYGKCKVITREAICVSAFCEATVQKPPFLPRGNGGSGLTVLIPKTEMSYNQLLHYASQINIFIKWRYSYGRMVNKERLTKEYLPVNSKYSSDFTDTISTIIPKEHNQSIKLNEEDLQLKEFAITDLFSLQHGDFHSITDLDNGSFPTISRIEYNNGIVGYYEKPEEALVYPPLTLTVSTVTGDCFVQLDEYIATDNVVVLTPKISLNPPTLFFIALMVNKEKWRWMYGRQCYKTKFSSTIIKLPADENGINEQLINNVVATRWGWKLIQSYIQG